MRRELGHGLVVICVVAAAQAPARVHACSPPAQWLVYERAVAPSDGATGVPTNVQVHIAYGANVAAMSPMDHPTLRTSGGDPVAAQVVEWLPHHFVLTPTIPLAPNTQYLILSDYARLPCVVRYDTASYPPCAPSPDAGVGEDSGAPESDTLDGGAGTDVATMESAIIASFTTGQGSDLTLPSPPGRVTSARVPEACSGGGCCFDYDGFRITLEWEPASDDTAVGYYELSTSNGVVIPMQVGNLSTGVFYCGSTDYQDPGIGLNRFVGTPGTYQVVAIDLAGNRSAPSTIDLTGACNRGCGCRIGSSREAASATTVVTCLFLLVFGGFRPSRRG